MAPPVVAPSMVVPGTTQPLAQPQVTMVPAKPAAPAMQAAPQAAAPTPAPATASAGKAKLTLSTLLQGYSLEELGFNPVSVPAWVATSVDVTMLQEQAAAGVFMVNLGVLIDGVADIGFRNMLSGAKRDFQVKLPQNEVFHALTAAQESAPASAPAVAAVMQAASPPASPAKPMLVQPSSPAGGGFTPPVAESVPAFQPAAAQAPANTGVISFTPFGGGAPATPTAALVPASAPSMAPAANGFAAPAPASSFLASGNSFAPVAPAQEAAPLFPMAPEAPKPALPSAGGPVQPLVSAFSAFTPNPAVAPEAAPAPSRPFSQPVKAFDPFAPSTPQNPAAGFSSEQLLGNSPAASAPPSGTLFRAAQPTQPLIDPFAAAKASVSVPPAEPVAPLISADPKPSSFFASLGVDPEAATRPMLQPAAGAITNPFSMPKAAAAPPEPPPAPAAFFAPPAKPELKPAPAPAPAAKAPVSTAPGKSSFLGLSPLDTDTDQLLLRALLGAEEELSASRVVQLLAGQPGLCACVCLHGSSILSHADSSLPDAAAFQQQAADIARQLRGLAPLIGIEGAETFTLNAGGRLLTFCFPGDITVGVLHACEPGTGLRDKVTLVARELARMLR